MQNTENYEQKSHGIATRTGQEIKELAAILAAFPAPDTWTQTQKAQAVQFAALWETAQKIIAVKDISAVDYEAEKQAFIANVGKTNSKHTRIGYKSALYRLDAWVTRMGINPLELTPAQADDFIYALRADGRAPASIRLDTAAASSFFTFLHRRHTAIDNPFRGSKARPAKKAVRDIAIPSAKEVKAIIAALPPMEAAAVAVMAYRGLRAGGLHTLSITGTAFKGYSKGKDIAGTLPPAAMKAIISAALALKAPFADILPNTLEHRIARAIAKLHRKGKVAAAYSCHDLRHFYAVTEYRKDNDIHRLCGLLGHASIQVTENYLKSLKIES
jgi:site-specific recombinase XerC